MRYFVILVLFILFGCGTTPPKLTVMVDGYAQPNDHRTKYTIVPANKHTSIHDLEYQEYQALANRYLQARGYKEVLEEKDTEVLIYLAYGLTLPKDYLHSYNTPVYGQTGVSSSHTTGSIDSWGNVSASTTYTPDYGIIGSQTHFNTKTIQGGYVALRAIDFQHYLKTKEIREVWKTFSMITDSAVDLRKMFPVVMTATEPYIGKNTGKTVIVSLEKDKQGTFQILEKGKSHKYEHDSGLCNVLQMQRCPF